MQKLFILKKVEGVNHVIGKLVKSDNGDFSVESLLKTEGSEAFGIPVLDEQRENSEGLMNWIVSFLPPIPNGKDAFTQELLRRVGIFKFEPMPMKWLKCYKPDGRNTISFCEHLPPDCVRHDNTLSDNEFDENFFLGEYYDEEFDEEKEADEEIPCVIVGKKRCDSFPVYPENIPSEQAITDVKAFAKTCESSDVENLRTIHNTLGALAKCCVTDLMAYGDLDDFAKRLQCTSESLGERTLGELVKQYGHLVNTHTDIPEYYSELYCDFFGFLSYDLRAFSVKQTITI